MATHVSEYLRLNKMPHIWCPGCGTGIVLGAIVRAIASLGYKRDEVTVVTGIGCSSRTNAIIDFNTFQTTHGRALSFATGYKMARPEMKVIVITGDGDGAGIGGNHLIHTARRNIDITTVLINNSIYGMTGGQYSPLTPQGSIASTATTGTLEQSFDMCELMKGAGATFVARGTAYHAKMLENLLARELEHHGFSFIEAISQCPIGFGRRNNQKMPADMLNWQKDHAITIEAARNAAPEKLEGKFLIGEFLNKDAAEFGDLYWEMARKAQKDRVEVQ